MLGLILFLAIETSSMENMCLEPIPLLQEHITMRREIHR
jgi:hypothetical protein